MKQSPILFASKLLICGIGGYMAVNIISWLFSWVLVAHSYCSYDPSQKECGLPLYPKWEFQSWLHSQEFRDPIQRSLDAGCLTEQPLALKVMQYQSDRALIWYKGESGSTWLARFHRSKPSTDWQMHRTVSTPGEIVCHVDVIYSRSGGSVDSYYWYN